MPNAYRVTAGVRNNAERAGFNLMMLAAFGAIFALVLRQAADPQAADLKEFMRNYWAHGFPPGNPLEFLWWFVKIHTGRLMSFPHGDGHGGSTLTFLLFATGVWASCRSRNWAILALCLTPFALNFIAAVARQYPYGACTRLSMHLAPAICLMIGVGLAHLLNSIPQLGRRIRWVVGLFILFAAFGVGQMAFDGYRVHRNPNGRWIQRIARELDRHQRPGDEIAYRCFLPEHHECFDWYIARFGERVSWEGPVVVKSDTRRVWLVVVTAHKPGRKEEVELRTSLGPGWETVARTQYLMSPYSGVYCYMHCTIHCLARDAGPIEDRPLLQSGP